MGMRVEAVWKPRDEWGTTIENISHFRPTGEPDADYETYKQHLDERRCGRRVRPATDGGVRRVADVRGAARAALRRALRADRLDPSRHRLLVLRVVGLPGRPVVLVRAGRRRDRRDPAGQRVARRDGRRVGALRGLAEDPDRRGRHRAGLRLRQELGRRAAPYPRAPARPLHDDAAVARHRVARRPPGARRHRRRALGRARDGRGGQPLADRRREERVRHPQGRVVGRGAPRPADVRRPAAQARLRARHRRRRRDRARRGRQGPRGLRATGVDHQPRDVRRPDQHGHPRPDPLPLGRAGRARLRPRRRRGRRAARAVQPPGADPALRARSRRRRRDQPVRRTARRQPDVHRRPDPLRRGGEEGVGRRGRPRCSGTRRAGRPCSRTSSCVMEASA